MAGAIEPNSSINWHYKEDTIRVSVEVPGLKTVKTTLSVHGWERKPDHRCCTLDVSFADNKLELHAKLLKGTVAGTEYHLSMDKEDLNIGRIKPEPESYYKVDNNLVKLFVKKR